MKFSWAERGVIRLKIISEIKIFFIVWLLTVWISNEQPDSQRYQINSIYLIYSFVIQAVKYINKFG